MKAQVLRKYQGLEGHDSSLTIDDVAFLHEIVRDDFTKVLPTTIYHTYVEAYIIKEVKQWYELDNLEFLATHITRSDGNTRITVELSGVAG